MNAGKPAENIRLVSHEFLHAINDGADVISDDRLVLRIYAAEDSAWRIIEDRADFREGRARRVLGRHTIKSWRCWHKSDSPVLRGKRWQIWIAVDDVKNVEMAVAQSRLGGGDAAERAAARYWGCCRGDSGVDIR